MPIIAYLGANVNDYKEKATVLLSLMRIRCPEHPSKQMALHDKYPRTIKETGEKIVIHRLICHKCRKTIAILPDFLLPNKHYSADEIESVIMQREAGTCIYDIDTPAGVCTVRHWLAEIPKSIAGWVSKLKFLAMERYACPVSETVLCGLPLMEQVRHMSQKLPRIRHSGNLLGYARIYVQSHAAPNST